MMADQTTSSSSASPRWMPLLRILVPVFIAVHLVLFVLALPLDYANRMDAIEQADFSVELAQAGLSAPQFAGYNTVITALTGVVFCALGLLILFRRPNDFMPLVVSMVLVAEGTQISGLFYAFDTWGAIGRAIADVSDAISSTLLVLFFLLFPSGAFVPRWTRWFAVGMAIFAALGVALQVRDPVEDYPILTLIALVTIFGVMIYAQVYRYRRDCSPMERQQIKWVLVGMITALSLITIALIATIADPERGPLTIMFWYSVATLGVLTIPAALTISILRHRLFDIDVVINRTLVYGTLTLIIGAGYATTALSLQYLLGQLFGGQGLAVGIATLAAVAAVRPLRSRIQDSVDRRFFRRKYDAAAILAVLGRSIQEEVDIDRLQQSVATAIDRTVQPGQISIWLPASSSASGGTQFHVPADAVSSGG